MISHHKDWPFDLVQRQKVLLDRRLQQQSELRLSDFSSVNFHITGCDWNPETSVPHSVRSGDAISQDAQSLQQYWPLGCEPGYHANVHDFKATCIGTSWKANGVCVPE